MTVAMKLVDTSCWIEALRRSGDPDVRARLETLVRAGEAAWCALVRLELWAGVGNAKERRVLAEFEEVIPDLPVTDEVWRAACELAALARSRGRTIPATDLLVASCAWHHGAEVEHVDRHFIEIEKLRTRAHPVARR